MTVTETYVRARIDKAVKNEATAALRAAGLSMSDFIRIALTQVAHDKVIPFDLKVPNEITIKAMDEARAKMMRGEARALTPEELFNELDSKK